jgi:hypothetical protein
LLGDPNKPLRVVEHSAAAVPSANGAAAAAAAAADAGDGGGGVRVVGLAMEYVKSPSEFVVHSATPCEVKPFRVAPEREHKSRFRSLFNVTLHKFHDL